MNETHHLMETRKNLERALAETEGPMRITSENIYHREGRKVRGYRDDIKYLFKMTISIGFMMHRVFYTDCCTLSIE